MWHHHERDTYALRILACTAGALLLILLCFKLWPPMGTPEPLDIVYSSPDQIHIEDILPTRQARRAPPPPAPLPPVVVDEDVILDAELDLDISPLALDGPPLDDPAPESAQSAAGTALASEVPKPIRIVTPEYPRAAERRKIRAEVVVAVIVDRRGRVDGTDIVARYLLDEQEGTRSQVDALGFGLEEAALSAAERSLFRPARKDGIAVASNHQLSFKFGV